MTTLKWYLLILGFLFVESSGATDLNKHSYDFLTPSQKHADDSPLHPGEGWVALRKDKNNWEIISTRIKTSKVDSGIAGVDYDVVISSQYQDTVAFFRMPLISVGRVLTPLDFDKKLPFYFSSLNDSAPSLRLDFNGEAYDFVVTKQKAPEYTGNQYAYPLIVNSGNKRLTIRHSLDGNIDAISIVWAGDLDRDGKLDVIIEPTYLNAGGSCVLLSSKAKPNELFGYESCHIGSGD